MLLAACGGGGSGSRTGTAPLPVGTVVDVYSSLPLQGRSAALSVTIVNGIRLALRQAHGRAGRFRVHYISLDDASAAGGAWDASQTAANARRAIVDPKAIYYIGDLSSGASEVSAPILNQAGIPQVSPGSTYVGLTQAIAGVTAPTEPQRYFPTGKRTFMRLVPSDLVQAAAQLEALREVGCTKLAIANDREPYGSGLAAILVKEAADYGVGVVSNTAIDPQAANFHAYAEAIKGQGAECFAFAGTLKGGGVQITKDVNAVLPEATIIAPDEMCRSAWTNQKRGGVPASVDAKLLCTRPTLALTAYPGGREFLAAYRKAYGPGRPSAYAILGYEAMKLGLDTISAQGKNGDDRADVLSAMFNTSPRASVIGAYSFTNTGDTTLNSYGLYKVAESGNPVFSRTLTPTKYISGSP